VSIRAFCTEQLFRKKPLVIAMFGPPPASSTPLSALREKWGIAAQPHKVLSASRAGWPARHRLEPGTVIRSVARADQLDKAIILRSQKRNVSGR
jgi:hypothetical protein